MKRLAMVIAGVTGAAGAACGGGDGGGDVVDARTGDAAAIDAATDAAIDGAVPRGWSVTIVAPPAGDAVILPLAIDHVTGDVVGYAGAEAWGPRSRPVRARAAAGHAVQVLAVPEANYGFAWGAAATVSVGEHAWRPTRWMGARETLPVPDGWFSGSAHAAVDADLIVGSWADYDDALPPNPIGPRPCAWIGGAVRPLALLDPAYPVGAAWAVAPDGAIAGALASAAGPVAVRWPSASAPPVALPIAGATLAEARAIVRGGDVAGRATLAVGESRAFVARGAGAPALLPLLAGGGPYAEARDLSSTLVVGTASAGGGEAHAVAWIDGAIVDLNDRVTLPDGVRYLSAAVGVTERGVIAAEAVMSSGTGDAVRHLAILTPE